MSFPLASFFFILSGVWRLEPPKAAAEVDLESADLDFFLSDLLGELEPSDRGLLLEPSGLLEESDFLEEKNLPLKTIA